MWLPHEQLRNRAHVLYHVEDLLNAMDLWCAVVTGIPNRVCALHEHFRALHVMVPYTPARRSAERAPCSCLTCPRVLAPPSSLLAPQPQRVQATAVPTALLAGCCVLELVQLSVVHVTDLLWADSRLVQRVRTHASATCKYDKDQSSDNPASQTYFW